MESQYLTGRPSRADNDTEAEQQLIAGYEVPIRRLVEEGLCEIGLQGREATLSVVSAKAIDEDWIQCHLAKTVDADYIDVRISSIVSVSSPIAIAKGPDYSKWTTPKLS